MGVVHTIDIGTRIILDTGEDISQASAHKIIAKSPVKTAIGVALETEIVETTKLQHVKTAQTLNIVGRWKLQAHVEFPKGGRYRGKRTTLSIYAPIQ